MYDIPCRFEFTYFKLVCSVGEVLSGITGSVLIFLFESIWLVITGYAWCSVEK